MIWNIKNTNANNSFRFVNASFLGYLKPDRHYRLNERYLDLWVKVHERTYQIIDGLVKKHLGSINPEFSAGLDGLENPLAAPRQCEFYLDKVDKDIVHISNNYKKGGIIISDSGGLQLFRAKLGIIKDKPESIMKKLHSQVFPIQAKTNFAMAFDHIVTEFTYEAIKESALKTVENIKEQLKIFDDVGGRASLLPIFSPVSHPHALEVWTDVLIDNLPWDNERLQSGVAFGGINYGKDNANLTPNKMYYIISLLFKIENKLKSIFGKDYRLPFAHLLGVLDKKDISILVSLPLLGYINTLSSDGRSFAMNFTIGKCNRFYNGGYLKRYSKIGKGSIYKDLMLDNLLLYDDIIKEYFEVKDIDKILQLSIEYFDKSKRDNLRVASYELLLLLETHSSAIHTIMKTIYDIEANIEQYKKIFEMCKNEPEKTYIKFKSEIKVRENLKSREIENLTSEIHNLL